MEIEVFSNPSSWGNNAWIFLHCVTYCYPENPTELEKKHYCSFFSSLGKVLPCPNCRKHYMEWYKKFPCNKFLENRTTLSKWLYELHNFVNYTIDKPLIDNFSQSQQLIYNVLSDKQQQTKKRKQKNKTIYLP
jgi:hypothetical protein